VRPVTTTTNLTTKKIELNGMGGEASHAAPILPTTP